MKLIVSTIFENYTKFYKRWYFKNIIPNVRRLDFNQINTCNKFIKMYILTKGMYMYGIF